MDAATVLAGETNVPTDSGFIPTAGPPATVISTGSEVGPTASPIVTRRKGKEVMVESDTPKKKKLQEQIDAQVARELERQLDREDLNQLWALVKEYLSIKPASSDKEMELWVKLKRMYEPDPEDQLWTLTQNYMHAPVEWKLYDLSGVHHVTAKDKEIFMLVEKYYPLRRGLALTSSGRELEKRLVYKDQMWQDLTNQKLSASTVTRWVTSQKSAEHPEVRKESYRQGSKAEEKSSKVETLKEEKDVVDAKLARLLKSSKDLENIIESQRSEKVKEEVGYNVVPPPAADLYLSPKKDLSWTGLPEFVDDTLTNYSRPSPTIVSTSVEDQNKDTSTSEDVASTNPPKPFVKFVKPKDSQPESMSKEQETPKKS
nr:hypothetical protein [Tanacetum cinerariifolium]